MAGAFTESTVIGTASDTIDRLEIPEAEKTRLKNNIPVAYAVTYLVGTGFVVWFLSAGAPRLFRVDLKAESQKLASQVASEDQSSDHAHMAYKEWSIRAYRLDDAAAGRTVADFERFEPSERVFIERIRRGAELMDATPETILRSGDVVAIAARRRVLLGGKLPLREELEDPALLDFPMATFDVVVTKRDVAERPLSALADQHGRGVALGKLIRGGEEIPFGPETIINRGDLLRLTGAVRDVERVGKAFGYVERPSSESDVVFLGLGIVVGGLVGLLTLDGRRASPHAHDERRCAHHGSGLRLAALGVSDVRQNPRTGPLDLRYCRSRRLHRHRRIDCRSDVRQRTAPDRAEPADRRVRSSRPCHTSWRCCSDATS